MPAKTVAVKPNVAKKFAAKSAVSKPEAKAMVVESSKPAVVADPDDGTAGKLTVALRVKDLVDRVSNTGDFKKKDVRDIVEATLAELGAALEAGEVLNLPPFGKLKVGRSRDLANGSMMTLKLRRTPAKSGAKKAGMPGLADGGEAG